MTQIQPFIYIQNNDDEIMDYLIKRTDRTIGNIFKQCDAIVVGEVTDINMISNDIHEDKSDISTKYITKANNKETVLICQTEINIDRWLYGYEKSSSIIISYPMSHKPGEYNFIFEKNDEGLFFLVKIKSDFPCCSYLKSTDYQLIFKGPGFYNFYETYYDKSGLIKKEHKEQNVNEMIDAVVWYCSLPLDNTDNYDTSLILALNNQNEFIVRQAIRGLAYRKNPKVINIFKENIEKVSMDLKIRYILGLWILGDKLAGQELLKKGKDKNIDLLSKWDLKFIKELNIFSGPDPAYVQGD